MRRIVGLLALLSFSMVASAQWHSIDTSEPRGVISLSELLRVIQFYNDSGFHCDAGTEDGYAPGAEGDQSCAPSNLDYNPQNWVVSLEELMRCIQFYNARNYYPCPSQSTEDGFCAGTPWDGESGEMAFVPAGSFQMGDSFNEGGTNELPVHTVYLDAYAIGKYEVTNQQFADVLNWAYARGELTISLGGLVKAFGKSIAGTIKSPYDDYVSSIVFQDDTFSLRSSRGMGAQSYSMAQNPVLAVTWYGAVAYCNWRSEMEGLQPCYNFTDWSRYAPVRNGYRLPTEAEWERAAAWDGSRHWRYGFTSDSIDITRANYLLSNLLGAVNPLGLYQYPHSSPVGWFDGVNMSPNGNVQTVDSPSPVGAYDMIGNVQEWCEDWYASDYYASSPVSNPQGPVTGSYRVLRGGLLRSDSTAARAASRVGYPPNYLHIDYAGLRIARTL